MSSKLYSFRCLLLALAVGFSFSSCSDDDEDEVIPTGNQVAYNGTTYSMKSGLVLDYGATDLHYDYDFYISDGTFNVGVNSLEVTNGKVALFAELLSPGTDEFRTGTFNFVADEDDPQHEGKYVFEDASIAIDSNNDNTLNDEDDDIDVTGGKITVSGSNRNYTIVFDLTLSNGKTVKGGYSGAFAYQDMRD